MPKPPLDLDALKQPTVGDMMANWHPLLMECHRLRDQLAEATVTLTEVAPARSEVMSWYWREQPDLTELTRILTDLTDGRLKLYDVETGSDEYAIVLTTGDLDDADIPKLYDRYLRGDES